MNKQQLFSGLVGTLLTLGIISGAAADQLSWQYNASSDTVSYAFSGADKPVFGHGDYPATRQAGNQPWQYDASSDTVSYAVSGRSKGGIAQSDAAPQYITMDVNLPWYYYYN